MVQLKVLPPCNQLERLRKIIINLSQECCSPGLEENLGHVQCRVAERSGWSCGQWHLAICCTTGSRSVRNVAWPFTAVITPCATLLYLNRKTHTAMVADSAVCGAKFLPHRIHTATALQSMNWSMLFQTHSLLTVTITRNKSTTLCRQNSVFLMLQWVGHIVTTVL